MPVGALLSIGPTVEERGGLETLSAYRKTHTYQRIRTKVKVLFSKGRKIVR